MKSILVVDDEPDIIDVLKLVLTHEGYHVFVALNGKEALDNLSTMKPDLILLDMMMPILHGLEMLRKVKMDSKFKNIPVIMMSAARPAVKNEDHLWDAFLNKPFELDKVLEIVTRFIGKGEVNGRLKPAIA